MIHMLFYNNCDINNTCKMCLNDGILPISDDDIVLVALLYVSVEAEAALVHVPFHLVRHLVDEIRWEHRE